jgi:sulfotransferase
MRNGVHFISGLPRSGSTLLAAILRQNPAIHAGMSSPVASLVLAMQRLMSQENETATFIDDDQRETVLRAIVSGFYDKIHPQKIVLDTNRAWCAKLPLLARLYPQAKIIACVRDVGWIMDSFERVIRANPLEPSRIFGFDPGGTVYSRISGLSSAEGAVGFALNAVREAFFSAEADRLMLVPYETLTAEPARALAAIYAFLDLPDFAHDFNDIDFDAVEFDQRLGAPGLHRVGRRVAPPRRETILPPGLFASFAGDAFWRDAPNPRGVTVLRRGDGDDLSGPAFAPATPGE